jgi:soluble P-type ATPase
VKPGITVEIPGRGTLRIDTLATDYTGTLSCGGAVPVAVKEALCRAADLVDIHVLTADTFGTAARELAGLPLAVHYLEPGAQDEQKMRWAQAHDPARTAAFGNGVNDRLLLRAVKDAGGLAVAVDNGEGCAVETLLEATVFIGGAANALLLLLEPARIKATLRR